MSGETFIGAILPDGTTPKDRAILTTLDNDLRHIPDDHRSYLFEALMPITLLGADVIVQAFQAHANDYETLVSLADTLIAMADEIAPTKEVNLIS